MNPFFLLGVSWPVSYCANQQKVKRDPLMSLENLPREYAQMGNPQRLSRSFYLMDRLQWKVRVMVLNEALLVDARVLAP